MLGYVYRTTNLIDGKVYIGQHHKPRFERSYYGSGKNIKEAVKKYGKHNFKVEVLQWCEIQEELDNKELYHIQQHHKKNPEAIYNIVIDKIVICIPEYFTEEMRLKCKIRYSGKNNPMYGVSMSGEKNGMYGETHTEETKKLLSETAIKLQYGKTNKGLIRSEEFKKKVSNSKKGAITLQSKNDIISKMLIERGIFYNELPKTIRNIIASYRCGYYQKEKTLKINIEKLCDYLDKQENVTILIGEYKKDENFYKGK